MDKALFSWKDSVYAIPLKPYTRYIMFNKDLFDLEGMKSPDQLFLEGNWNWSTFRDACRQLTKTTDGETSQMGYDLTELPDRDSGQPFVEPGRQYVGLV